jgi:hypothetical protein
MDSIWIGANTKNKNMVEFKKYTDFKIVIYGNILAFFTNEILYNYDYFKNNLYKITTVITDPKTGYRYYNAEHSSGKEKSRIYFLQSKDFMVIIKEYIVDGKKHLQYGFDHFENYNLSMTEMIDRRKKTLVGDGYCEYEYIESGIKSIVASSYLIETIANKKIDYKPEYLISRVCKLEEDTDGSIPTFDNFMRCWAEGVPGDGIGEWLEVEFARPSDEIMILNGYVDFKNMSAYKNNNRLKRIRIESQDPQFNIEYTLPDYVAYHSIPLPQKTKKVKITILEVYKGLKYEDTCVTAIALPQERKRSIEEEKKEVLFYLKQAGFFEYLERYRKEAMGKQ